MLSRYASVDSTGEYKILSGNLRKVMYGFMLSARYILALECGKGLAKAVLIAWQYSNYRKQFGDPERPVINY